MKMGNKIKRIKKVDPERHQITLVFEDGAEGIANLQHIFSNRKRPLVAEILRGNFFSKCFVESGALAWPNGYELCPDMLRNLIQESKGFKAA